jgi:lipopolysaccharide exporter
VTPGMQTSLSDGSGEGLTLRSLGALKWNYAGVVIKILAQSTVSVVLARLLGPEPFGVYSAVLLVSGVGAIIVERGFGAALIQTRDLSDEIVRYTFTQLVLTGLLAAGLLCMTAHSVAALFGYPPLTTAIYGSALYLFVYAISVVPGALLRRDLDLKSFQIAQILAYLIAYVVVGIGGACAGLGVWSLIGALVTQLFIFVLIACARVRQAIRPLFKLKNQQLTTFGNLAVQTNLLNWAIENLDNLLIGRVYGMHALGLYAVSYNLVRTPTDHVITTAQGVLFAAAARAQENIAGLRKAYLTATSAVLLVLCPVFLGIASVAPTVVAAIYGEKWVGAEALLVPLGLAMPVHGFLTGSGVLWARSLGATERKVEAGTLAIFLAALLAASRVSLQAIAWAVLAVYIFRALWLTSKILNSIQLSWRAFLEAARGGLILGAVVSCTLHRADISLAGGGMAALTRLCVLAGVGFVIVTVLPICLRGAIVTAELRALLNRATPPLPRLLRTVMQLYLRA